MSTDESTATSTNASSSSPAATAAATAAAVLSDEAKLFQQVEEFKSKGNAAVSEKDFGAAISWYSQGIVCLDRWPSEATVLQNTSKAALLSNRALCHLKVLALQACWDDCTAALEHLQKCQTGLSAEANTIRCKVWFRRSKAAFLLATAAASANSDANSHAKLPEELLQDAAKDLLQLLQQDPNNTEANQLLQAVRLHHKQQASLTAAANTPISKTIAALKKLTLNENNNSSSNSNTTTTTAKSKTTTDSQEHQLKILMGLLENDWQHGGMELARAGGLDCLLQLIRHDVSSKTATLAMSCWSLAASYPAFCRAHWKDRQRQEQLCDIVHAAAAVENVDLLVSALAVYVKILLHVDRDKPDEPITGKTIIDTELVLQTIAGALTPSSPGSTVHTTMIRAVLDFLSTWTAGDDRDTAIRTSLYAASSSSDSTSIIRDPLLPVPKSASDIRAMSPPELAAYRKRTSEIKTRNQAWAFDRAKQFMSSSNFIHSSKSSSSSQNSNSNATAAFDQFCKAATTCPDHIVRREMTVTLGRLLAALQDDDPIKQAVSQFLKTEKSKNDNGDKCLTIEEVYNEDDEEAKQAAIVEEEEQDLDTLEMKMKRAFITAALLLSKKEMGAWALATGWETASDDLPILIQSGNPIAMCLASEVVSAAATVEAARAVVANLVSSGAMEQLLSSPDRDIRSGAASAVAKLGISDRATQSDEGEIMALLQAACELLEDQADGDNNNNNSSADGQRQESKQSRDADEKAARRFQQFHSYATSSVERAIEMISYLIANTDVKEELAAGFTAQQLLSHPQQQQRQASNKGPSYTALERLVQTCNLPNAGESLSGFALASIFQNMAATNLQIRREGFEGKEVTMEQYDDMQKLGKTAEEKEVMESQKDPDTQDMCNERIRKMAAANVPRAMVALMEGASEHTLEQLVRGWNRMAGEPAVRGIMIQQGVLSACIKVEKNEGPTETDTMKKVIQLARHSLARILISTNPSLLTTAQRLGSIKPLLQLVRDIKATDLQQFEALMAVTNLASSGEDAQTRIASEKGLAALHFAMFSDHEMVRRAATEAMCNMVPHKSMMDHLASAENLKLWITFAADYEENYECARAAAGCLAMATQEESIALEFCDLKQFQDAMTSMLESGRLELMHRTFAIVHNLCLHGGKCKDKVVQAGLVAFCRVYVDNYHNKNTVGLDFPEKEAPLLPVTVEIAKKIVATAG